MQTETTGKIEEDRVRIMIVGFIGVIFIGSWYMNNNYGIDKPHPEDPERDSAGRSAIEQQDNPKDLVNSAIDQYLFTPRSRSKKHAREFLKDWMQRYNRG